MAIAKWQDVILAESQEYEMVEGNIYFPPSSINKEFFKDSDSKTRCSWKGTASYYNIEVDGEVNSDAAWYYPEPKEAAMNIKNYIAFWKGVDVTE